jgi:hypothetical protein
MRYQVVTAKALHSESLGIANWSSMTKEDGLLDRVRTLIGEGWIPQGGVAYSDGMFAQAMVKECDGEDNPEPEPEPNPEPKPID